MKKTTNYIFSFSILGEKKAEVTNRIAID